MHLHEFPDEHYHHYPLGEVTPEAMASLFANQRKMEIFTDSSPYVYDKAVDSIVYKENFDHLNPEAIYPDATGHIDGLKLAKVTNYGQKSGTRLPDMDTISAFNLSKDRPLEDRIDFIFQGKSFVANPTVYVSVFNSEPDNGPIDFSIQLRHYHVDDIFSPHL